MLKDHTRHNASYAAIIFRMLPQPTHKRLEKNFNLVQLSKNVSLQQIIKHIKYIYV